MRAHVSISVGAGPPHLLVHGDVIGRLRTARLPIDDPRVSEAHALVSLRGGQLKLLALRGRLRVDEHTLTSVALAEGMRVELAPGIVLHVGEVVLPDVVVGLVGEGLPRQPLDGVRSLVLRPRPRLEVGVVAGADAVLWGEDEHYRARLPATGEELTLALGDTFTVAGRELHLVPIRLRDASVPSTLGGAAPLHLIASYDTVQLHQSEFSCVIGGIGARIVCELIDLGGPVAWDVLASELWGADEDRVDLRPRFDMAMTRLRRRLRGAGIRDDLVVLTGTGQVELVLRAGDRVEDRL
ncbi:MAG: hypothetical protein EP329_09070 [Deltaproteobacteria bacterium]|nr:MAG: hypothetical protein EP329_09070 [Deltaproteobacteria bacterium]